MPKKQLLVYVPPHPLVKHYLNMARNEVTPTSLFRGAIAELGRILLYEATSDWYAEQMVSVPMRTPCGEMDAEFVDPMRPVRVVPILRAGLVLLENAASVLPVSTTHHLGYVRDEETLQPSMYLNKLPERFTDTDKVLLVDPMLATGGTMHAAVEECISRGALVKNIRCVLLYAEIPRHSLRVCVRTLLRGEESERCITTTREDLLLFFCADRSPFTHGRGTHTHTYTHAHSCITAVCAPPALQKLSDSFNDLVVYSGGIDPELSDNGFIIPGLGDAGDRCFGT